ncbi:MAG: hypothetical protein KKA62_03530 [Nanoarchaeota archaeon]|nr:hypothetical protein [Nanoarchaeota archaeon]MBU1644261.1 hypothetical protein [Nanoarchaeota archaeon]MBU1976997.1 hypothetical protein [Nanoarchaeota archaeon]
MKQKILPSVMAKDQKELDDYFKRLKGSTKEIHLDISDGKFVSSKILDFKFKLSDEFRYNAHLMIKNPLIWIKKNFNKIDLFIPHIEEIKTPQKYIQGMKSKKKKIAFALRPENKITTIKPFLKDIDYVLILTVHPGFYGSKFLKAPLRKIKQIKKINPKIKIIVDGGIHPKTIKDAVKAGGDYFVSGSFTTRSENPKARIKELLKAMI